MAPDSTVQATAEFISSGSGERDGSALILDFGDSKRICDYGDNEQQRVEARTVQVHRVDLCMDLWVPEMGAREVFDDLPHWDEEPQQQFDGKPLSEVIWDREVADELFDERLVPVVIWDDGRGCYSSKDEIGPFLEFSEGTPLPVFDEMPLEDVVWDEEIGHHTSYYGGLVEQLATGGQFMGSEEITMGVSLSPFGWIPRDGSVALFSPEARYGDHLVLDEMPSANVVWDDVMSGDGGPWHGSLEELQQCDHYSVDEKTKPVIKLDVDVKPPHVASDEISRKVQWDDEQLPDQVAEIASKMVRYMELLHDPNLHNDLLQPLTLGVVLMDKKKAVLPIKLNTNEVLTHECRPSLILECDGHDAGQMLDKASKHGMIELTHFSAVQLELINDSVHGNATAPAGTQAISVSDQRRIFMVPLVFKSAANRVFNKLPAWSHGNFSPGESEQQRLSCRMNSRQWDPGIHKFNLQNSTHVCTSRRFFGCHTKILPTNIKKTIFSNARADVSKVLWLSSNNQKHLMHMAICSVLHFQEVSQEELHTILQWQALFQWWFLLLVSGHNWERYSSIRYIDVTPDHLCEDAAAWSVFSEAAHSSKQGISVVYLAHKSFPSGFLCFRSDERSFCPWNNEAICQEIFLMIVSMNRPWYPGIGTATAWGQAVFREGGNVMTHMWAKRSNFIQPVCGSRSPACPAHLMKPRTKATKGRRQSTSRSIESEIETEERRGAGGCLPPPEILSPSLSPCYLLTLLDRSHQLRPNYNG